MATEYIIACVCMYIYIYIICWVDGKYVRIYICMYGLRDGCMYVRRYVIMQVCVYVYMYRESEKK